MTVTVAMGFLFCTAGTNKSLCMYVCLSVGGICICLSFDHCSYVITLCFCVSHALCFLSTILLHIWWVVQV